MANQYLFICFYPCSFADPKVQSRITHLPLRGQRRTLTGFPFHPLDEGTWHKLNFR